MPWYERKPVGLLLRLGGLALLVLACLAGRTLRTHAVTETTACLLAAITFLFGSAGAACLFVGPHLFEPVEIAERWRRRRD